MTTRWQLHRHNILATSIAMGALACRVETVDLHGSAIGGSGGAALEVDSSSAAAGMAPLPVPPPETAGEPEPSPPSGNEPQVPDVGFYQPLPDAGVDLAPLAPGPGCRNVDFLFVVDNSLSMTDEQDNLVASFAGFMDVARSTLSAQDYHIMAVDTDDRGIGFGGVIDAFVSPSSCNGVFGAGRRQSSGGQDCGIEGSASYMTEAQPDLDAAFSCAARVGTFGDVIEQPMTALLSAVGDPLNGAGGCNEGFLRDDALLVVTFITDEDDTRSPGDPALWRQQLIDAKGGDAEAVVVLGLVGDSNLGSPLEGGPCSLPDAAPAPRLQAFAQSLPHGSLGSVCAEDYAPFLAQAVTVIDGACDTFELPPR